MTRERPARQRVLAVAKEQLEASGAEVQEVAKELGALNARDRNELAQEVRALGDRLQTLTTRELSRLDVELRLRATPSPPGVQIRALGQELSLLGTSLAQVGLSLDRTSLKVRAQPNSDKRVDPRAFRLFTQGFEVSNQGYALSHLARRLLSLGEEQLRFLRTLLDRGPRPRRAPRVTGRERRSRKGREDGEVIWGGIEAEDLIRRDPRKVGRRDDRRKGPKRVLTFSTET